MTIQNEAQLANTLETLSRLGVDYFGILSHYDRILVALSALYTYSDKMRKCLTVDDLLAHISERCDIDPVSDALKSIATNKGSESRGVNDYVDTVAEIVHFTRSTGEVYDFAGMLYRMHAIMVEKSNAGQVNTSETMFRPLMVARFR